MSVKSESQDAHAIREMVFLFSRPDSTNNYSGISIDEFGMLLAGASTYLAANAATLRHVIDGRVTAALLVVVTEKQSALLEFFSLQTTFSITYLKWPDKPALIVYNEITSRITEAHLTGLRIRPLSSSSAD
jgi:hypothetical protein